MESIEEKKNPQFGRRVLGIGWPAERNGFAVVIGEEAYPTVGSEVYKLHFLDEAEAKNVNQLFMLCAELIKKHGISEVIGRRDEHNMGNLYSFNDDHPGSGFDVGMAPHSKDGRISHHVNILLERLENETLVLPKDSKLWTQFEKVKVGQTHVATDAQFPAVAALGYIVADLTKYPSEIEQDIYEPPDDVDPTTGY